MPPPSWVASEGGVAVEILNDLRHSNLHQQIDKAVASKIITNQDVLHSFAQVLQKGSSKMASRVFFALNECALVCESQTGDNISDCPQLLQALAVAAVRDGNQEAVNLMATLSFNNHTFLWLCTILIEVVRLRLRQHRNVMRRAFFSFRTATIKLRRKRCDPAIKTLTTSVLLGDIIPNIDRPPRVPKRRSPLVGVNPTLPVTVKPPFHVQATRMRHTQFPAPSPHLSCPGSLTEESALDHAAAQSSQLQYSTYSGVGPPVPFSLPAVNRHCLSSEQFDLLMQHHQDSDDDWV